MPGRCLYARHRLSEGRNRRKNTRRGTVQAARSAGQRKKRIGEVVSYALSHRTRILILIVLNEGIYAAGQVAKIVDEPLKNVANHMRELADCGSIELVKSVPRRNMMQHYYTAVQMPCYTEEDMEVMPPEQRDVIYGLVIQSLAAEMMAALWKGSLSSDPKPGSPGCGSTSTARGVKTSRLRCSGRGIGAGRFRTNRRTAVWSRRRPARSSSSTAGSRERRSRPGCRARSHDND